MKLDRILTAASGVALAAYVVARPWQGGNSPVAWADPRWPLTHLAAVAGFSLFTAAAWGGRRTGPLQRAASLTALPLLLPYYGAEALSLHAIAREPSLTDSTRNALAEAIRMSPLQAGCFAAGWLALAVAGVTFTRTRLAGQQRLAQAALIAWATGLCAYFPVFYLPVAVRVAHGVLLGAAGLAWALSARDDG